MESNYSISGMTCGSCIAKVQKALNGNTSIQAAKVQLTYPQAQITSSSPLDLDEINTTLGTAGKYHISKEKIETTIVPFPEIKKSTPLPEKSINTYKPLILIIVFISGISLLSQYPFEVFLPMLWMRHFMAGFFVVFAFFKLLNLEGFASTYKMYDIIAAQWNGWGYVYPFLELILGILYLTNLFPFETNIATAVILGVSSIGVIQSNLNNKKIKCACLGNVFNLPMSTVTIVEDLTMVAMAIAMLAVD